MATEIAISRMRRSLRLAFVGALCLTAVPVLELLSAARPRVLALTTICAVVVWATVLVRWRAFRAAVANPNSGVQSI